ncbi:MAG: hypothetical protein JSV96_00240 [Candidatus Aminicenantes bacterium]|nr:MAG: hypothetical protein JSV96_00240 [Candidatus Aminicenantes bacterium]
MKNSIKIASLLGLIILFAFGGYFVQGRDFIQKSPEKISYSCIIEPGKKKYTSFEGERLHLHFRIKNTGRDVWSSRGKNPCLLSYHLLDQQGKTIKYDNRRFPLPRKVSPSRTVEMTVTLGSPLEEGKYILEFDMLREGIAWFKDYGAKTSKITLSVKRKKWPEDKYDLSLDYGKYTKFRSSVEELNKIFKLIRITLNYNNVEFKGKTGKIKGFSAGTDYPQIWLRDANTITPASRYFYDKSFLSSWVEEHLAFQGKNGALRDWIDSRGSSDKNTTETDQEASAIQAAHQIFELLGPSWLEKKINGETIIHRLEKSLDFVFRSRFNKEYGLITGAHTADWGDVDMVDEDQKAIYVDEKTHWTADIYDQSMVYQACLNLAQMLDSLGKKKKSVLWLKKSESIKENSNKWLWQKEKGFYKVHLHLDSLLHDFDEEDIFAMGGNTVAMISGLGNEEKSRQIIAQAIERQKSLEISTISGTLLPPYPSGVFRHPQVDDPFEYQNGGQWDWFGGRLIYAMFENGFSRMAKEKLIEILEKNLANRGFFEWENREGAGHGSDYFCGSAGSLSKAIFEGYFGLKLGKKSLNIEPKLGKDSAIIHVYIPANNTYVAYEYKFDDNINRLTLEYSSNFPNRGKIKILNPWHRSNPSTKENNQSKLIVRRDGKEIPFTIVRINYDEYLFIETDFKKHLIEIEKEEKEKK